MSAAGRRRPPCLADTTIAAHGAQPAPNFGQSGDLQACVQQLSIGLHALLERHQEQLQQAAHLWSARQSAGWRSAGVDGFRSADSARIDVPGVNPTTPKLDPPPRGTTYVTAAPDGLRQIAEEIDKLSPFSDSPQEKEFGSPSPSQSSTRCISHNASEENMVSGFSCPAGPPPRPPSGGWVQQPEASMFGRSSGDVQGLDLELRSLDSFNSKGNEGRSSRSVTRSSAPSQASSKEPAIGPSPIQRANTVKAQFSETKRAKSGAVFSPLSKRKLEDFEVSQGQLERFTRGRLYEGVSAAFIVLNAVFILWETESRAQLALAGQSMSAFDADEVWFTVAANLFALAFVVDVILRVLAEKWHFVTSEDRTWNVFDIFVTLTAFVEVIVHWCLYVSANGSSSSLRMYLRKLSMLRIVRLLRVIRITRAIRVIRFVRELRSMVLSLCWSFKPLLWSVVLMLIVLLVFGVFFTDGTVAHCIQNVGTDSESEVEAKRLLKKNFGTLFSSTLSLYMAMTGGEDWANIMHSLDPLPYEYRQLFLVFITFAILALMNVVTAVFVGTAMQRSQMDRELVIQQELENKDEFVFLLQRVFEELDANSSGGLSLEEFERYIDDDKIMAYLRTLGINISQARTLFMLLDVDQGGEVDVDEFASGLLRLKGGATSMDMAILKYQTEWIHHNVAQLRNQLAPDKSPRRG